MSNTDGLIKFTKENASEMGKRGKIASDKKKKEKKLLREHLMELLEMQSQSPERPNMTNAESISLSLVYEAENGNVKAYEVIRDTIGEKPVQEIALNEIEVTIDETDS